MATFYKIIMRKPRQDYDYHQPDEDKAMSQDEEKVRKIFNDYKTGKREALWGTTYVEPPTKGDYIVLVSITTDEDSNILSTMELDRFELPEYD